MSARQTHEAGRWYYRFKYQGKDYCEGGFRIKTQAVEAERLKRDSLIRSQMNPEEPWANILFEEAAQWMLQNVSPAKSRGGEIDKIILPFAIQFFRGKYLSHLLPVHIDQLFAAYERERGTLAPNSYNRYLSSIRSLYNLAIRKWRFNGVNPVNQIVQRKAPRGHVRFLSALEESTITPEVMKHADLWPYYYMGMETGMRIGEMRAIRIKDLDMLLNQLFVPVSKSGRSRYVPLLGGLPSFLEPYRVGKDSDDFLLPRRSDSHLRRKFRDIAESVGMPLRRGLGVHVWRHTFAYNKLLQGMDLYMLSKVLGHSTYRMTEQAYGHLAVLDMRRALERVEPVLACNRIVMEPNKMDQSNNTHASKN